MGRLIEREIEIEGVGAQGNSPIHSFLMNDCCSIGVGGDEVGLVDCLMGLRGYGPWPAMALREEQRTSTNKPTNSSSTKQFRRSAVAFADSNLSFINQFIDWGREMRRRMKESNKRLTKRKRGKLHNFFFLFFLLRQARRKEDWSWWRGWVALLNGLVMGRRPL